MIYVVTRKADGAEVYRYSADAPIEWAGFEFALFDHTVVVDPIVAAPQVNPDEWRIAVGAFFDRFGAYKWPILASADPVVQAVIKDASVRPFLHLYDRRTDISMAIDILMSKGFAVDKAAILDTKPAPSEVPA